MKFSKAFTLIEMLVVIVIIWVWLIWVISVLTYSYKFLFNISNRVTAVNLAREGMEWVFSVRNTNWIRWWGKKDRCWLKVNPLIDENNDWCENDTWFGSWSYILWITGSEEKYFYLSWQNPSLSKWNKILSTDWKYLLCKKDSLIQACPSNPGKPNNYFASALYFRQVRWGYLLDKKSNTFMNCSKGDDSSNGKSCGDGRFLEKNFCVDVVYFDGTKSKITLCSILTNFKK